MAPLIKGHGGAYKNTGFVGSDTVEKRCYMPVIPYIVGAASVNRNCGIREQLLLFFRKILYSYIHDFPITILWNKRSNGGLQKQ